MNYDNNISEDNSTESTSSEVNGIQNNSWQSGIKFVEEKKPKKVFKIISLLLVVFFSASIGGIIGGYYVNKNYNDSQYAVGETNAQGTSSSVSRTVAAPKESIAQVAQAVGPAVVGVSNNVNVFGMGGSGWGTEEQGSGSGIIFDKDGYIVTNYHVIDGASSVTVTLPGGRKIPAKIVGGDKTMDLAVLKIDNVKNLPVAKFGDSSTVSVGDTAIAIGNPLGEEFAGTVTAGIISAVNREITVDGNTNKYIQTDASINPGNSGGALCNSSGEVIGINTLKSDQAEGMGFAIPINLAKPVIDQLMKNGYISRPYLGIGYTFIDQEMAQEWNVPVGAGIQTVDKGSAAAAAGIMPQDIIVTFDGKNLMQENDLKDIMNRHKVGDVVTAKIWRNGKYLNVTIKLGDSRNGN